LFVSGNLLFGNGFAYNHATISFNDPIEAQQDMRTASDAIVNRNTRD
jgi:hypothetical protein